MLPQRALFPAPGRGAGDGTPPLPRTRPGDRRDRRTASAPTQLSAGAVAGVPGGRGHQGAPAGSRGEPDPCFHRRSATDQQEAGGAEPGPGRAGGAAPGRQGLPAAGRAARERLLDLRVQPGRRGGARAQGGADPGAGARLGHRAAAPAPRGAPRLGPPRLAGSGAPARRTAQGAAPGHAEGPRRAREPAAPRGSGAHGGRRGRGPGRARPGRRAVEGTPCPQPRPPSPPFIKVYAFCGSTRSLIWGLRPREPRVDPARSHLLFRRLAGNGASSASLPATPCCFRRDGEAATRARRW